MRSESSIATFQRRIALCIRLYQHEWFRYDLLMIELVVDVTSCDALPCFFTDYLIQLNQGPTLPLVEHLDIFGII